MASATAACVGLVRYRHPVECASMPAAPQAGKSLLAAWIGMLVCAALVVAGVLVHATALLNHDVAWLLIAAQRMLDGGNYVEDFFEVNMPLAIAAYIPPYAAARLLHLPLQPALALVVGLLCAQAAALAAYCLFRGDRCRLPRSAAPWFAAGVLLALLFLPGYDFGQKEHLVVILVLPLICALAGARDLGRFGRPLRLYLSVLAAAGFYLKPHYALLPLLLLAGLAWRRRSLRPLASLEMAVLLCAAAANAVVVLLLYPDWFVCARWAADLYGAYRYDPQHGAFFTTSTWICALCLVTQLMACLRLHELRPLLAPLLGCIVYAWVAYLLQLKAWSYQFLPVELFTFVAQWLVFAELIRIAPARVSRGLLAALAALLLAVPALWSSSRMPGAAALEGIPQVLAQASPGDPVYVFSFEVEPFMPAVPLAGMNWASRYSHLWPLLQLARLPAGDATSAGYRGKLVDSVIEDFERRHPQLVIVDRRPSSGLPAGFDILGAFTADLRFARLWRGYERVGSVNSRGGRTLFEIYWYAVPATADRAKSL